MSDDWLVGGNRRTAAAERIYAAATDLIARKGLNALDIDVLATRVHCSRATIYRYVGGKAEIRDVVMTRAAARIVDGVVAAIADLRGRERVVASILAALQQIRTDPLGQLMIATIEGGTSEVSWLAESGLAAGFARDVSGIAGGDPHAGQWIVRVVMSLMFWPAENEEVERELVERFVGPAFAQ